MIRPWHSPPWGPWVFSVPLVLSGLATHSSAAAPPRQLIQTFCADCHSADSQEAELDLVSLVSTRDALRQDFKRLDRIRRVIESGEMPPRDADPQPTEDERRQLVAWLKLEIAAVANAERDDPGMVVMPRLTRHEYRNVMRDLSGGVVTDAGRLLPSEGGAGEGFSNVGAAQGISPAQFEKYVEAARGALRHLRVYPLPDRGFVWRAVPRESVDNPKHAIKEATDDIIAWHVAQQQKWGAEHRAALDQKHGSVHAIYLEAAWRAKYGKRPLDEPLSPVALEKWTRILSDAKDDSPFIEWAKVWRTLPGHLSDERIRAECLAIATGQRGGSTGGNNEDYAPPYEEEEREEEERGHSTYL
ncbi:MAG TPA: DUF1587 domain-containing protein [Pirellulaceae bacterium]|nr:DUF1587 domain-containing protein [Pirellulaceae bacterium]